MTNCSRPLFLLCALLPGLAAAQTPSELTLLDEVGDGYDILPDAEFVYESILIPSVPGRWTIEGQGASPDDPTDAFRLRFSRGLTFQVDVRDPTPATDQMTLWNGFDFTGVPTVITSNLYLSGPYQASWDPRSTTAVPDASVALEFVNAGSYTVDITTSAPSFPRRVWSVQDGESLQQAIDGSSSGDRIELSSGTFEACADLGNRSLEIIGAGISQTFIQCSAGQHVIRGTGGDLQLGRLTVQSPLQGSGAHPGVRMDGGSLATRRVAFAGLSGDTSGDNAGAALWLNNVEATLLLTQFNDNSANTGGAVFATDSRIRLLNSTATDNSATTDGGAFWLSNTYVYMNDFTATGNSAGQDGGVFFGEGTSTYFESFGNDLKTATVILALASDFSSNSAGRDGGVYAAVDSNTAFFTGENTQFRTNTATEGGGAIRSNGYTGIFYATMTGNSASRGGAIYGEGGGLDMKEVTLTSNQATGGAGGAIYWLGQTDVNGSSSVTLTGCTLAGNSATEGWAIWATHRLRVIESTVFNHTSGAIYSEPEGQPIEIARSEIRDNSAETPGAALHIKGQGVGVLQNSDNLFARNVSTEGGAVYLEDVNYEGERNTFLDNEASGPGGALSATKLGTLASSFFDRRSQYTGNDSTAASGGAVSLSGAWGGTVNNSLFANNTASGDGGALWVGADANMNLDQTRFEANSATNGGVLAIDRAAATIDRSLLCENIASTSGAAVHANRTTQDSSVLNSALIGNSAPSGVVYVASADTAGQIFRVGGNSFTGNGGVFSQLWIDGAPRSGIRATGEQTRNSYRAATIIAFTSNATSNAWINLDNIYQTPVEPLSPIAPDSSVNTSSPVLFPLAGASPGCSADLTPDPLYLDPERYHDRTGTADELFIDFDSDGFTFAEGDCDPSRTSINPGAPEVPANYADDDCDYAEDFDEDGDGFGPDRDCDDLNPDIPGTEIWYNDVYESCFDLTDWDQDADGVELLTSNHIRPNASPFFFIGDCDDEAITIGPGNIEIYYDGVDGNCDQLNDYDKDRDGFVRFGNESGAGGSAPDTGDCDDDEPSTYPGAPDAWYDGIDSDCANNNDYDADGDGYVSADYPGTAGSLEEGDCDDSDPNVNPGQTEVLGNGLDDDCDSFIDIDSTVDTDGDDVPDTLELTWGSDPNNGDSDGDGLLDGDEWRDSCAGGAFGEPVDTDGDGIYDYADTDSDDDGIDDATEQLNDTDDDCIADFQDPDDDNDGLTTADEISLGTDPYNSDTDGDSVPDAIDPVPVSPIGEAPSPSDPDRYGCGCQAQGSSSMVGWGWMLLAVTALRRRHGQR